MQITHLCTEDRGGAAQVGLRLQHHQLKNKHRSHFIAARLWNEGMKHRYQLRRRTSQVKLERLAKEGWLDFAHDGSHYLLDHPLVNSSDVVHLHNLHGDYFNPFTLAGLSHYRPTVWTLHDMQALTGHCAHAFDCDRWQDRCGECPDLDIYPALQKDRTAELLAYKRAIYKRSRLHLVTPSKWLGEKVSKSILADHSLTYIPNGVNIQHFSPKYRTKSREKFDLPLDKLLVGAVAQAGALGNVWKGGTYTREILKTLLSERDDVMFVDIGGGGESSEEGVLSIPYLDNPRDLAWAYSALDVFLYTSIADNCPLVVLEAMACGLPMVTFATGGIPELVRHGSEGFLAPTGDTQGLLHHLRAVLDDAFLRDRLALQCRNRAVTEYDYNKVGDAYLDVYKQAIAYAQSHPPLPMDLGNYAPDSVKTEAYGLLLHRMLTKSKWYTQKRQQDAEKKALKS